MRQVFLEKGTVVVKDVCRPLLDDFSILVSVHYSFVSSGTELATIQHSKQNQIFQNVPQKIKKVLESVSKNGIEGTKALIKGKLKGNLQNLGYSCSGRVIAVGKKVRNFREGDYVACAGAGLANHADIVCVPELLAVKLRDKRFLKAGSLTTVGAIALQGIRRAGLQLGETVCVIGLGLLGQITIQLAKLSGCRVVGIDLIPDRIRLARRFGATLGLNAAQDEVRKEIEFLTGHHGVDSTIITAASQSDSIVQQAMEVTRKKGRVVLVGDVGLNLQRSPFYKKEIDFLISCSYGPGRYDQKYEREAKDYPYAFVRWTENRNMQAFVNLMQNGAIDVDGLIAHEASLEKVEQAYEMLRCGKGLGVVLNYLPLRHSCETQAAQDRPKQEPKDEDKIEEEQKDLKFRPVVRDKIRVGVVGAGGFAKVKLMPIISKIKKVEINAIVDADIGNATNNCRLYAAAKALTDDRDLFKEDLVDAVVIASPHKFHSSHITNALRSGKAVFCEKPMVTDYNQLHRVADFFKKHPEAFLCVDFNRSFSPYMQKIKQVIKNRTTPLVIHYRMNARYIPGDHWVQTEVGAGRIIGEACHIFDLFSFLTDARPVSVSAEALHAQQEDIFSSDNFTAQIRFDDGSICSLLYSAVGHADLGKERMELFFDGKSIVMNDYKELTGFGLPRSFNEKTSSPDKGHEQLLKQFFRSLTEKGVSPISFDRLYQVSELSLIVDSLVAAGGGEKERGR